MPTINTLDRRRISREFISVNNQCGKKLNGGGSLTGQDIKKLIKSGEAKPTEECKVILAEKEAVRQAKKEEAAEVARVAKETEDAATLEAALIATAEKVLDSGLEEEVVAPAIA